jgi:hypothetical protein
MNSPKYLIMPGQVKSATDGQSHFISAFKLMNLYGVRLRDCLIYPTGSSTRDQIRQRELDRRTELIRLGPRNDGKYQLELK